MQYLLVGLLFVLLLFFSTLTKLSFVWILRLAVPPPPPLPTASSLNAAVDASAVDIAASAASAAEPSPFSDYNSWRHLVESQYDDATADDWNDNFEDISTASSNFVASPELLPVDEDDDGEDEVIVDESVGVPNLKLKFQRQNFVRTAEEDLISARNDVLSAQK